MYVTHVFALKYVIILPLKILYIYIYIHLCNNLGLCRLRNYKQSSLAWDGRYTIFSESHFIVGRVPLWVESFALRPV